MFLMRPRDDNMSRVCSDNKQITFRRVEEGSLGVPAQTAAPATQTRISGRKWMDGWKVVDISHRVCGDQACCF